MCNSAADNPKLRSILWPVQTILLVLSPQFMIDAFMDQSTNKRSNFMILLKKSLQTSRNLDLASVCYVDICKAATYVSPHNESILRLMVADIESDLRNKVWNFANFYGIDTANSTLGYTIDQQALATDFLLSRIKLDKDDAIRTLIPSCMDENAPIIVKLALVKSFSAIMLEEYHLPWNPTLDSLRDSICTPLRTLFLQVVQEEMSHRSRESSVTNHRGRVELLVDTLRLYRSDPSLAVLGSDDRVEENIDFMRGLATLLTHPAQVVRQAAAEVLVKLHQPNTITQWAFDMNNVSTFWRITSPPIVSICRSLLDTNSSKETQLFLLGVLIRLIKTRLTFINSKKSLFTLETSYIKEKLQAANSLELSLLILLSSAHKEVCDESFSCLETMLLEVKSVDVFEDGVNTQTTASNMDVYRHLCVENYQFMGRKAQQKRIRQCLQMLPNHTLCSFNAWEEAWKRWKMLTPFVNRISEENETDPSESPTMYHRRALPVGKSDKSKSSTTSAASIISKPQPDPEIYEEKSTEWQNFTGFLAALGGCCLTREREINDTASQSSDHSKKIANGPYTMVDGFVAEMTEMLVSSNVYVREGVKDTLGSDLSPTLFMLLFRHLEDRMKKCFDSGGQPAHTNDNRLFVEQLVLVLRLILDRLVNPGDYLLNIDFSTLVRQILDYLDRLSNTYATLRIKIKACILIEALMDKKENIIIQNSIVLRNKMLEILVDWTSHVSLLQKPHENDTNLERLQRDLDQTCLKAIVNVLYQLPLQPLDSVRPADATLIKSKLFLKHFNFFRKVLDGYKRSEREIGIMQQKGSLVKTASESYQDIAQMKELIILAMSHLLSANVEAGLKYSLSMGYDDDEKTRTSFMQVLTNILDQGTEFETLAENVVTDRYEKLVDVLVNSDMEIALTLCAVCPSTDISGLAEVLLVCFESRGKIVPLLKAVVEREVIKTEQEATLFRGTTMATRLLSAYAKIACVDYIRLTLLPVMQYINTLPDNQLTWELDPQKLNPGENVVKNKANVLLVTEKLLQAICSSVDSAPRIFREELELIATSVGSHFPEAKYTAVGGFVFLRLFGPAILSPETAGFAKNALPKSSNTRKILLQATRIIQNLANNVLFGAKEPHMVSLNDFLTNNIYRVTSFLRSVSTFPESQSDIAGANLVMDQSNYTRLHKYLTSNLERISRDLTNTYLTNGASTENLLQCKKNLESLSTLLAQLGRPSETANPDSLHTRNYAVVNSNHNYSDFMRKHAHKDLSIISAEHKFYLGGKSKKGRPVFYLFTRTLDHQHTDFELLTYYMLRVMEPYLDAPFELMYDTTGFTLDNAIPINWLDQLFSMIFNNMNDYLVAVHILNPTTHLLRHMLKLPRPLLNKVVKRLHIYSNLSEAGEAIEISEFKFAKATLNLEKNPSVTIYPVTRLTNQRISLPVIVKISSEELQIISMKKQEIFESYQAILRDVYHISQLEDITPLLSMKSDHGEGISIKHDRGKSTMVLLSPQRDAILSHLRRSKQRYESSRPSNIKERAIRPNDVPGRLLNMALVNVGSSDPSLRLAAYNLLYSLSQSFKFHIGNQLFSARDMCIPSNSTGFVVSISENLALTELHLTLEFLDEAIVGLLKSNEPMQQLCLDYMVPWWRNLESFSRPNFLEEASSKTKIREIIMSLIDITMQKPELYKHMQNKVWKNIAEVEEITGMVIDCFVQYSVEKGMGSSEAEMIADTFVTMGDLLVRGKLITRLRRVIEGTSIQPCRQLVEHRSWREITVLLRFGLMLSFNSFSGIVSFLPEIYHTTTMVVVTGPTLIRSTVHKTVVNVIHNLCTTNTNLSEENRRKLQYILNDICDSKNRVLFGLTNQMANAFTITPETTTDYADSINLSYLQNIVKILIDTISYGAANQDVANKWRARWMSLVTSTAFYFNPAIQPRAFVVLGCLAQDEVDDDLLYQILVALKGALAIFVESEPHLIISIIMCLTNLIDNLPSDSRYLLHLFWLSVSLVQIAHPVIFQPAVEFLHSVLRALDSRDMFLYRSIEQVLLAARIDLEDCATELDKACEVSFKTYFSFAIAVILLKGLDYCENKDVVYKCLSSFLVIESKHFTKEEVVEASALGYLTGLIPFAAKGNGLADLLQLACYKDIDTGNIDLGLLGSGLFDFLEIPENSTALLFVSLLVALLNTTENETEKAFLYKLLAGAATAVPEVFSLAYEPLLPKMNQIVLNTQNHELLEAVKNILLTACSESAFVSQKRTQKWGLENLGFEALINPMLGLMKHDIILNAKLASRLLGAITDQQ
ncbi:hypothetical protein BY458DRAFT_479034 [Sporodiniella umbellata]|nr:hypothetical protein BY458DRAFT_479034 [Sporodiniella umbellata]